MADGWSELSPIGMASFLCRWKKFAGRKKARGVAVAKSKTSLSGMMDELYFKESEEGVHLMQPYFMDEGSLCGLGCDNSDLKETREKVVTCKKCIFILKFLRNVKYKE
jgi:hypothetical protein